MRTVLLALALAAVAQATDPHGSPDAEEALALCHRAQDGPAAEKADLLARGLSLAERAVAADERDAVAHFAVFCHLGEQLRQKGVSFAGLTGIRRLRREVDRTLELAPDYADALAGKGSLLLDTPRLLGGDAAEGEALLRRALAVDPDYLGARLDLARALADRGARAEARAEAGRALVLAERRHDADAAAEARKLLARAGS